MSTRLQEWVCKFTALSYSHTEVRVCNAFADRKTKALWKINTNARIEGSFISFLLTLLTWLSAATTSQSTADFYSRESKLRPPLTSTETKRSMNASVSLDTQIQLQFWEPSLNLKIIPTSLRIVLVRWNFPRSKRKQLFSVGSIHTEKYDTDFNLLIFGNAVLQVSHKGPS